jgi:hypothetical protein
MPLSKQTQTDVEWERAHQEPFTIIDIQGAIGIENKTNATTPALPHGKSKAVLD